MDRPELSEALLSVERQTYPAIEIILVDATGKGLTSYQSLGLQTTIQEVSGNTPWNRPAAANAALRAARGTYLMFLDEDDWIAPQHIANLVLQLNANLHYGVAYSSTRNTAPDGSLLESSLRIDFDAHRLRRDNFIPIHSALFRRELVELGCKFDESLDIFEDWDFWLQCATHGPFIHIDELSAFYRQGGESNTASQDPATRYRAGHAIAEARNRVFEKWRHLWNGEDINQMLASLDESAIVEALHADVARLNTDIVTLHADAQRRNADILTLHADAQRRDNEIRGLNLQTNKLVHNLNKKSAELDAARARVEHFSQELQRTLNSLSWRITRPLRWLRYQIGKIGPNAAAAANHNIPVSTAESRDAIEHIHCNLDIPSATQNEFSEQITLQGWCCSDAGTVQITVKIDGTTHAHFGTGISRPDIAELFQENPNAFSAGFYQEIDLPELSAGEHILELEFTDTAGNTRVLSRQFTLFKNDDLYNNWYWRNTPDEVELNALRENAAALTTAPHFHLIVYGCEAETASIATLSSIAEQAWSNWEITLVTDKKVSSGLEQYLQNNLEHSAKIQRCDDLHAAWQAPRAAHDWVLFLRAGETLAPQALFVMGQAARTEDCNLIYSDHDHVDAQILHSDPTFTPQWAPEHLLASNYVGGVFALRADALQYCSPDNTVNTAWRYGILLQLISHAQNPQRLPALLWSAPARATDDIQQEQDEQSVLRTYLQHTAPGAELILRPGTRRAVAWPLPDRPRVSIIIPTMGKLELLKLCIESLLEKTHYENYEVIILDNSRGKNPEGIEYLKAKSFNVIECNEAFNWARLNNIGARHAKGDLLLFLNDDIEITNPDWLEQLVRQARRAEIGAVGALLYYPNGALQHTGVLLVNYGGGGIHLLHKRMPSDSIYRMLHTTTREVAANTGACLMVSRDKFDEINGFDEELAVVGNDVDFCLRLLDLGYRNIWTPLCALIHHESISRKTSVPKENERAMWKRWSTRFMAGDPYYNPQLSAEKGDFTLQVNRIHNTLAPTSSAALAAPSSPLLPGVNLIGYTRAEMGIGEGARSDAKALDAANEPFGIICFQSGNPSRMTDLSWEHKEIQNAPYDISLLHINPDHAQDAIDELPASHFDGHYVIGYWAWELPEIPAAWEKSFRHFDEIWVPSHFVQDAVALKSPVPVIRIPHAVEVKTDATLNREYFGLPGDAFLFLAMFDTYSRPERKNPFGALRAFQAAFAADDVSAQLVLKVNNATPAAMAEIRAAVGNYQNIILLDREYSRAEVNTLIANCDCYVSLHRSEGFGFGPAEAMAVGKPIIATQWSGNIDYMRPDNSIGITYTLVTIQEDYGPYKKGQVWAEPDIADATRAMKRLAQDRDLGHKLGRNAQATIAAEFSPAAVGELMRKRLAAIRQRLASESVKQF